MSTTDLEPVSGEIERSAPLLPAAPGDAQAAMLAYQQLCAAVLGPDDWIGRPGERDSFVKKSGWAKLATFYGVSTELVGDTILERDADGNLIRAAARARAIARDGRHADGGGACSRSERRFGSSSGRQKIEHDLPSTAETRAMNRAIASLIGFGAVSAEEADGDAPSSPGEWADDVIDVGAAAIRFGDNLESILVAAGITDEPEALAVEVGNGVVSYCKGKLPAACALLARLLAQAVQTETAPPAAEPEPETVDGELEPDTPAAAAPDIPPEGEQA